MYCSHLPRYSSLLRSTFSFRPSRRPTSASTSLADSSSSCPRRHDHGVVVHRNVHSLVTTKRPLPGRQPRTSSQQQQQQHRTYVFLPTSWTELKLRLRQKAQPTVLRVHLQRPTSRRSRPRLRAAVRWAIRQARRRLAVTPALLPVVRRGLWFRVREMLTGKGGYTTNGHNTNGHAISGRRLPPRSSMIARRRPFSQEQVVKVTIEDYMQNAWFDEKGRPTVAYDATGRFVNPWISQSADGVKPLSVLWKWREQRLKRELREFGWNFFIPTFYKTQFEQIDGATKAQSTPPTAITQHTPPLFDKPPRPSTMRFTWIGHATCLIQQGNMKILTDPIFSQRASPWPRTPIGIARAKPAACTISELPNYIDLCLISHDHYDHLDKPSVRSLRHRVGLWVVPTGTKEWMISKGKVAADRVVELAWWESVKLVRNDTADSGSNDLVVQSHHALAQNPRDVHPATTNPPASSRNELWISCLPVQHWCSRTIWDRNYRLWASYAVLFPYKQCFYFTGDTALPTQFPLFDQIRSYLPWPISLAAIPIGAYEPAILNDDSHVNPVEAIQILQALRPRQAVAIHHGSFPLSEEPLEEPAKWLSQAVVEAGLRPGAFVSIEEGACLDCLSATNRLHKKR